MYPRPDDADNHQPDYIQVQHPAHVARVIVLEIVHDVNKYD
jgi:hypothetical protein